MSAEAILVIILASVFAAFVKGVTGLGYPLIVVPLATLVTGIEDAVVAVAVPNLAANLWMCWSERSARGETRDLPRLLVPGVVGAVVGTFALVNMPEEPLLALLALTVLGFVVLFVRSPELRLTEAVTHRWSPVVGAATGVVQGAVGTSGPVIATWLHGYRLGTSAYVYAITLIFAFTGSVQITVLVSQGEMTGGRLVGSLAAGIPMAVMIPLGTRFRERLDGPRFERAVMVVLVATSIAMIVRIAA
ncbi:MAG TPA: sulfite exporter TauE/SafE family protein [Acidimicrobiales bacterium]|nr:sulfite exporter TauE/SafE family protein [Acidimicrobiales bacterium]